MTHFFRRLVPLQFIPLLLGCAVLACASMGGGASHGDPLPSWNEGPAKSALVAFVEAVSDAGGLDYVAPAERIAVFDNDGTLWIEQPIYTQLQFALDRVKALAPEHPEWKTSPPFDAVLSGDMHAVAASGMNGLMQIVMATHAGMTADAFARDAEAWLEASRHPRFDRRYTELVYQPQLELLAYLRANDFQTWIVSGGGVAFMRPWTEAVYGVPPEQVVGSRIETEYRFEKGRADVVRKPAIAFIDDKAGKPVGIESHIGRRPILAVGNSDGDLQMVQYATAGEGRRLGVFIHHTDADREYAYDREGHVGVFDAALDMAAANGWIVVDMKRDWRAVFPHPSD